MVGPRYISISFWSPELGAELGAEFGAEFGAKSGAEFGAELFGAKFRTNRYVL